MKRRIQQIFYELVYSKSRLVYLKGVYNMSKVMDQKLKEYVPTIARLVDSNDCLITGIRALQESYSSVIATLNEVCDDLERMDADLFMKNGKLRKNVKAEDVHDIIHCILANISNDTFGMESDD